MATAAAVTASSQNTSTGQTAAKAIDGSKTGYPGDYTKEWATLGGKTGSHAHAQLVGRAHHQQREALRPAEHE